MIRMPASRISGAGGKCLSSCAAVGIFVWLALGTKAQHITISLPWTLVLVAGTLVPLGVCGTLLWRRTRFS